MKTKIITFGELLLRFSKNDHFRLPQGSAFRGNYGGSEANVAVSLAMLGEDVGYVTCLPDTPIGRAAAMRMCEYNVGMEHCLFEGGRMGSYYFEDATSMRNSMVIYDRANSSYSQLTKGKIPWEDILSSAAVFHVSGIAPAISQGTSDVAFEALETADRLGLTISFDINYRKNLWRYGASPQQTLDRMLQYCDVVFGDQIEYSFLTGMDIPFNATKPDYFINVEAYTKWFEEIHRRWPRCRRWLLGTRNQLSSSHHLLTALLWSDGKVYSTKIYDVPGIVDPMGVGDAFAAAQLHIMRTYPNNAQYCLDYALAAATLKNSISGDFNLSTNEEIECLMKGEIYNNNI